MMRIRWRAVFLAILLLEPMAAARQPKNVPPPIVRKANTEFDQHNYEKALALYREALRKPPKEYRTDFFGYVYTQIGACNALLSRWDEAVAALNQANSFRPDAATYSWLGFVYDSTQSFSEAARSWQSGIDLNPGECVFYAGLAFANGQLGRYDEAQRAIDQGSTKTCTPDSKQMFRDVQNIVYLGKGMYRELSRLVGEQKLIWVILGQTPGGVRISKVFRGGPADLAGLLPGDLILFVNGEAVPDPKACQAVLDKMPFGSSVEVRINRNGTIMQAEVIVGIPPNLPALAAAANSAGRPARQVAVPPASPALPSLVINGLEVKPARVGPGAHFSFEVSYTATNQFQGKSPVGFRYSIEAGSKILFESSAETIESASGKLVRVTKTLTATRDAGSYTIRVRLALGTVTVERHATLTVARASAPGAPEKRRLR